MEYDLVRMGSTLFEDMSVALCSAEFGPGGTSYGVGADGGREWTYRGELPMPVNGFPSPDDDVWEGGQWDGYTVVQAKHKSSLSGGQKDVDWLLTTIQKEVKEWLTSKEGRAKKPKNLLVITNVRLSAVPRAGGIDRLEKAMKRHATDLKLAGWAIWSATHVSRLLDNHRDIRKTYLGQLVVGDVLAAVLDFYERRNPEATAVVAGFAAKELYAYRHVRLTRAGSISNREHDNLADVGIDLPAFDRSQPLDSNGDPLMLDVADAVIKTANAPHKISNGGFATVLVGGPGQGKSTIGQLVCQAYRAAHLVGREAHLTPADRGVLNDTLEHLKEIGLPLPTMLRWPVYIQLSKYSEKLLNSNDASIQAYIAEQINDRGDGSIVKSDVSVWLSQWPWMLVLDGLDEVPDAGTRGRVLQKINEFMSDAADKKADVHVLATTRPQGYQQDLSSLAPRELELAELSHEQAISYGKKLVFTRNRGDLARARETYARLEAASNETATANLMGTPLQVSIMASLLEDRVRVPGTRYKLFDEFYDTVYRREVGKEGKLGAIVERYKTEVDKLHDGAGIRLHVESEKTGQADVHLKKDELREIAEDFLIRVQTYERGEASKTASRIVDLASDRLVLLVEESADHWGYEVRSFQEFMASRFITEGEDDLVLRRLRILARSSHWRNTWLFAATHVFDSRSHLRERLVEMLIELDNETVADSLAKPGAQLSCDLISDNFAIGAPGIRKRLLMHAVSMLDSPILNRRIILHLNDAAEVDAVIRRAIKNKIDECLLAGGRRQHNIRNIMSSWSQTHVGGIPAYIRQKSVAPLVGVEETGLDEQASRITFGAMVEGLIDTSQLNEADTSIINSFLSDKSTFFVRSSTTKTLYVFSEAQFMPDAGLSLIVSDEACDALDQAVEKLPTLDVSVSNWFVRQVAQLVGQRFVSAEAELESGHAEGMLPRTS